MSFSNITHINIENDSAGQEVGLLLRCYAPAYQLRIHAEFKADLYVATEIVDLFSRVLPAECPHGSEIPAIFLVEGYRFLLNVDSVS